MITKSGRYSSILLLLALVGSVTASAAVVPTDVRMLAGTFDPRAGSPRIAGSEFLPATAKVPASAGGRFYLVQFIGPVQPEWKAAVAAAGGTLLSYYPEFAFVARMHPRSEEAVSALPFVRFVGPFKPEWRVEPALLSRAAAGTLGPLPMLAIKTHPGESVDTVVAALRKRVPTLSVVKNQSSRKEIAVVRVPVADALTVIQYALEYESVAWIELWREPRLFNKHGVWKGQSDDRTNGPTEAAAAAPREFPLSGRIWSRDILGQGQVVAVADTGLRDSAEFFRHNNVASPWGNAAHQNVAAPGAITVDNTRRKVIAYNWLPGASDGDHGCSTGINPGCSWHGTHVAGSVAGDDITNPSTTTLARNDDGDGMAPQAKLIFQDIGTQTACGGGGGGACSLAGIPVDYRDLFQQAFDAGAHIHSDSWGSATGPYGAGEQQLDDFAFSHEQFLINFAAGNDDAGMNMVGSPCLAKNTLCTGALTHGSAQSDAVPTWSNEGWTPGDQRYKPDLSAPGENIVSADGNSDTATRTMSGTSMATPIASGYTALARQYFTEGWYPSGTKVAGDAFVPSAALLKAALIAGTRPVPNHSTEFVGAPCGTPCQDSGWGRVTLDDSLYFSGDTLKLRAWDIPMASGIETGMVQEYELQNVAAGTRLSIILSWLDAPGSPGAAVALTNNLDLEVVGPTGTIYRGNQWTGAGANGTKKESLGGATGWDTVNNVEGVQIAAPAAGDYRIRIRGFNVPGYGAQSRQGYAIAATANLNSSCSLPAPTGLAATPNGNNRIDLTWSTVTGATRYAIYRSVAGASDCSGAMQQIGQSSTTSFSDTTVQGGHQYSYHVKTLAPCDGPASNCATATATGNCTLKPTFSGLTSATNAGTDSCGAVLSWTAATSNCPLGTTVRYNIHRSTTPNFTPSAANRVATCVTGTSYTDGGLVSGTTYYYVVRAEDSTTGNGGACGGGNEETNNVQRSVTPFGTGTTLGTWSDGADTKAELVRTGPWSIVSTADSATYVRTGTYSYKSSAGTTNYPGNTCATLTTPTLSVGAANPVVSFWERHAIEVNWDAVVVQYSVNGGAWTVATAGTTATMDDASAVGLCGLAKSTQGYEGNGGNAATLTAWAQRSFTITAAINSTVAVRWLLATDGAVEELGFVLDDVAITNINVANACAMCTTPGVPTAVSATTPGVNTVRLSWTAGSPAGATYNVYRAGSACGASRTLLASGITGTTYDDVTVAGGTTYSYTVRAIDSTGSCPSAESSCVEAVGTGGPGLYSRGKFVSSRPEDTSSASAPVSWVYSTTAATLIPPGIGSVYSVSNDRILHGLNGGSATSTPAGGVWGAAWKPFLMNAPSQARPGVPQVTVGTASKVIFLGSQDGHVFAVDANAGTQLWRTAAPLGDMVQAAVNGLYTVYGGAFDMLIAATRNSSAPNVVYGLDPMTGSVAWSFDNGGGANGIGVINGDPWIDYGSVDGSNQRVYFTSRKMTGGSSGTVWCLTYTETSAALCSGFWPAAVGDIDGSVSLFGDRLYIGTNSGSVHALNATTGAPLWNVNLGDGPVKGFVDIDFMDGVLPYQLWVATTGKVWSITDDGATGTTGWSVSLPAPSIPLYNTAALYVGGGDGKLYEFTSLAAATPTVRSITLGAGTAAVGSPSYDFGHSLVYVGTDDGKLYAVRSPLP